jgi:arginase family enzyme
LNDYTKLFIVGYPCDLGAHFCDGRTGSERGPQNFHEILNQISESTDNAYYGVNLSTLKLKIFDCGNITFEHLNLESAH